MGPQVTQREHSTQSINPHRIVLDADGIFPKDIVLRTKQGETKVYRLIKTKSDGLVLNK